MTGLTIKTFSVQQYLWLVSAMSLFTPSIYLEEDLFLTPIIYLKSFLNLSKGVKTPKPTISPFNNPSSYPPLIFTIYNSFHFKFSSNNLKYF
jgi:hypothetical protein